MGKPLDDAALDTIFRTARTYNGYTDEPVSQAELHAIWELMKWGPTSANQLPARLLWCVSDEAKAKLAACASAQNAPGFAEEIHWILHVVEHIDQYDVAHRPRRKGQPLRIRHEKSIQSPAQKSAHGTIIVKIANDQNTW